MAVMQFPRLLPIRQNFPERKLAGIREETARQLSASGIGSGLEPGSRIAIGVGSRGISNIAAITGAAVAWWRERGMEPFLFPAMGSHGAATAEGQTQVLAQYGITEQTMGCPILSSLEVVSLGRTADGIEALMDANAYRSDGVMLINRVKWHTSFEGRLESGIFKMMAIGLGRFAGAQRYHSKAYRLGLEGVIVSAGRHILASGKVLGGIAVLEDAHHNTWQVEAIPAARLEEREMELLAQVKAEMPRILASEVDVLIVDEMGKEISGTGMDTKVVNRNRDGQYNPWPYAPRINRIFVRDLSAHTYGNAIGLGMVDMAPDRFLEKVDWTPTYVNALTAGALAVVHTPIHFPTDRECLERLAGSVGKEDLSEVTFAWIRNTLSLGVIQVSENLWETLAGHPLASPAGEPAPMQFDRQGNLVSPYQEARREAPAAHAD
jgi:hypothetical protein